MYEELIKQIIFYQSQIIGPLAVRIAETIKGIKVVNGQVTVTSENVRVVNDLVDSYAQLFGKASVEVCKEAVEGLLRQFPEEKVPEKLR